MVARTWPQLSSLGKGEKRLVKEETKWFRSRMLSPAANLKQELGVTRPCILLSCALSGLGTICWLPGSLPVPPSYSATPPVCWLGVPLQEICGARSMSLCKFPVPEHKDIFLGDRKFLQSRNLPSLDEVTDAVDKTEETAALCPVLGPIWFLGEGNFLNGFRQVERHEPGLCSKVK